MLKNLLKSSVFKISVLITLFFMSFTWLVDQMPQRFPFLSSLVSKLMFDTKLRFQKTSVPSQDIAIIAIDDKTIETFGAWPLQRDTFAKVIQNVTAAHPRVIAVNLLFEPRHEDTLLPEVIKTTTLKTPIVLGYFFYFSESEIQNLHIPKGEGFDAIEKSRITAKISQIRYPPSQIPTAIATKSNAYVESTSHHGFLNIPPDSDGVIRKTFLISQSGTFLFPSLALKMAALSLKKNIVVEFGSLGIEHIFINNHKLPVNAEGEIWIRYPNSSSFPTFSFSDVYKNQVSSSAFENKIILIGVTAKALADFHISPLGYLSGIDVHATIVENIIHNRTLYRPNVAVIFEMIFMLIMGLIYGLLYQRLNLKFCGGITFVLILTYFILDDRYFFEHGIVANSILPMVHLFFVFVATAVYKYFVEEKKSREIKAAFEHYVSPAVVNEILKDPSHLKLGGEKKRLTVLFSDIRGFTRLSEEVPPETLTHLINIYLTEMTSVVLEHRGTIDKYVGDELMALFGVPLGYPEHALNACHTAQKMIRKLDDIRKKWRELGVNTLNIGIGVHTGEMVVGNMGSNFIFDYTVIGKEVNLGSKLQELNKNYGTQILISEETYREVSNTIPAREIDIIQISGRDKPVKIYTI